ncbi:hypothetical protein ACI65C_012509 [Semiaphis heraclei]
MASTLFRFYILLIVLCIGFTLIHNSSQAGDKNEGSSDKNEESSAQNGVFKLVQDKKGQTNNDAKKRIGSKLLSCFNYDPVAKQAKREKKFAEKAEEAYNSVFYMGEFDKTD